MSLRSLILDIWQFSNALQVLLVAMLLIKKTWQRFPVFTAYACFNLFEAGITYALSGNGMLYFYSYWICEGIATILGFAVVYEVFRSLFAHHEALRKMANFMFPCALAFLVLLGLIVIAFQPPAKQSHLSAMVMLVAEAGRIIEVGLLIFLFLFSTAFGLHWKTPVFGIALGLGLFVTVDLISVTLRWHFGNGVSNVLNLARGIAFCLSVLMWAAYLFAPERVTSTDQVPERGQLEQWNQAVLELINR